MAAHPDDEVIGAGGLLCSLRNVCIVHTTNGSPLDPADARRSGFSRREEYAAARRRELASALQLVGIPEQNAISLNFTDREIMHQLTDVCRAFERLVSYFRPDVVLTQPYEGGHPDHDSTAFVVRHCIGDSVPIFEMTAYHSVDGAFTTGRFLPNGEPETVRELSAAEKITKQRMLACFESQASVLQDFPILPERFRRAPAYDFALPPHAGPLHYERFPWGITGDAWRKLAAQCR